MLNSSHKVVIKFDYLHVISESRKYEYDILLELHGPNGLEDVIAPKSRYHAKDILRRWGFQHRVPWTAKKTVTLYYGETEVQ